MASSRRWPTSCRSCSSRRPAELEAWLEEQPRRARGRLAEDRQEGRRRSRASPTREALELALCFGWIDSQKRGHDETSLPAAVHAAAPARALVADQPRQGRSADRRGSDAPGRPGRGRGGQGRRPLGGRLRGRAHGQGPRRPAARARRQPGRPRVLRRASTAPTATRSSTGSSDAKKPETRERRLRKFVAMLERGEKIHDVVEGCGADGPSLHCPRDRAPYTRRDGPRPARQHPRRRRRARLPRRPGVGVGRARRRLLRGDDQPAGDAARAARGRGAALDALRCRPRRSPTTAPSRRSSTPPTGGRSRRC